MKPKSREKFHALARSAQPIFLVGLSRQTRRSAANAILKEMIGAGLEEPTPPPDLSVLTPQTREDGNAGRTIGIDAARTFVDRLSLTPYAKAVRVGMIEPAGALTLESQNALLRYLEEPTDSSRIILSSRRSEDIIPTLLSRCQVVRLPGRAGADGEAAAVAESFGESEETVQNLYDLLDDPDSVEKILELRLTKPVLELHQSVLKSSAPDPKTVLAFIEKRIPAADGCSLFVETVFSAVCRRLDHPDPDRRRSLQILANRLLVLQMELRYNPSRLLVLSAVQEWLEAAEGR